MEIDLREVAFTRSGDKGNTSNILVAVYDRQDYDWLLRHLTENVVHDRFQPIVRGKITRYEMPGPGIVNFVLEEALAGGVSRSLNMDAHGKSLASLMLSISLHAEPDDLPPSGRGTQAAAR